MTMIYQNGKARSRKSGEPKSGAAAVGPANFPALKTDEALNATSEDTTSQVRKGACPSSALAICASLTIGKLRTW